MLNGHGNNLSAYAETLVADFSTNVYSNPLTDNILDHLKNNINCVKNYPDCNCSSLRRKIAKQYGLTDDHVFVCNGSTEAFYLVAHVFANTTSVIPVPSFAEYEDACKLHNHTLEFISTTDDLNTLHLNNKLVWIGNPNNPDGKHYTLETLNELIYYNQSTTFIVDEAYIDLCKDGNSAGEMVKDFPNLIVIKSFTKLFAIPGIRLGYVLAHPATIEQLRNHHMPWAVNALALLAGEFIMDKYAGHDKEINKLLQDSKQLQKRLAEIEGMRVNPSNCNYFLVQLEQGDAAELKDYLIQNYGFLIRDASNFRGLDKHWFRVATQAENINNQLINALNTWAKRNKQ